MFALLQRFHSVLDEQLALPHSGEGDCTNDSRKTGIASGISEEKDSLKFSS